MQVHNALLLQQRIVVPVNAGAIMRLGHTVAALDAFDDFVEFRY